MRAVYGIGVLEGSIAAGLGEIQDRFPQVDVGSYPFKREDKWGVTLVAKGSDIPAMRRRPPRPRP